MSKKVLQVRRVVVVVVEKDLLEERGLLYFFRVIDIRLVDKNCSTIIDHHSHSQTYSLLGEGDRKVSLHW